MLVLAIAVLALPQPVALDGISVERARTLHGKLVSTSFMVAKPAYTILGCTVIGAADRDDGAERGITLRGTRLDIDVGDCISVVGVMRVIDHPPAFVNGQWVLAWVELRVEE
jgi:hypothetical protein